MRRQSRSSAAMFIQQASPAQGPQDAGVELTFNPPLLFSVAGHRAIECRTEFAQRYAVFCLDVQHIQSGIPIAKRLMVKPRIIAVVHVEQEEWRQDFKQVFGLFHQPLTHLGQTKRALAVTAKFEIDQQVVQHFQRPEVLFVQHLVDAGEVRHRPMRPNKRLCRPIHENTLEGFGWRQRDRTMFGYIGHNQPRPAKDMGLV